MNLNVKQFLFNNKDVFLKSPKDAYNFHQDIIKICIEQYNCPDVFAEMDAMQQIGEPKIRNTKFYRYWINKQRDLKTIKQSPSEIIKTTREIVKKRIAKDKIVKQQEGIVISRQPINQTLEINRVYHKINFKTEMASKFYEHLDLMLKKIRLKSSEVSEIVREYKSKIQNAQSIMEVERLNKELMCFEKLYKMQTESFNDSQAFQVQLRMLIENEKQVYENNMYIKTDENEQDNVEINTELISEINTKLEDEDFKEFVKENLKSLDN
jgi:hypothetical protein